MNGADKRRLRFLTATLKRHNEHGTLWRPNTTVIVNMMTRLLRRIAIEGEAPFNKMLGAVSQQTDIPMKELAYLSDIGEWVLLDRGVRAMDDDEYEDFWEQDDTDLRMEMLTAPARPSPEIDELNALWDIV
jgi:hypothetical protein